MARFRPQNSHPSGSSHLLVEACRDIPADPRRQRIEHNASCVQRTPIVRVEDPNQGQHEYAEDDREELGPSANHGTEQAAAGERGMST